MLRWIFLNVPVWVEVVKWRIFNTLTTNTPLLPTLPHRSSKHTKKIYWLNLLTPAPTYVSERREKEREAKVRFNRVKFSPSHCCISLCSQLTELAWQPDLANLFRPVHHCNACTHTCTHSRADAAQMWTFLHAQVNINTRASEDSQLYVKEINKTRAVNTSSSAEKYRPKNRRKSECLTMFTPLDKKHFFFYWS